MTDDTNHIDDWDAMEHDRSTSRRKFVITVIVLALILAALFGWRMLRNAPAEAQAMPPTQVAAMVVDPQDAEMTIDAVASLSAVREVMLSAEVAGRVSAIRFEAGNNVGSGALLVQLYDEPLTADLRAAQARAEFARLQLQRSEELAPTGAEPRELLEQRRSQLRQAEAEIAQIRARLRQLQIRAPFSGLLGIREVDPGQFLNAGDRVASLTSLDRLYVDFNVPQQDLALLQSGSRVRVTSDAYPGREFEGQISTIEPRVDEDTRNIRVQAILPNPGGALRPGMYANASVILPPQENALVVPATAIQTSAQGSSVTVIRGENAREGGQAEIVPITVGRRVGEMAVVESGLSAGDVILTEGQLRVQPGAQVEVTSLLVREGN
ncbi:efflux RND transporter periplasmic adaptor subunit [Erythrobacter westpacificensis]|uniref:Efflux RND transporter periplasmic adaptor subunit n=1 Tax=Erythrobacter westpacificensis TaxID=1055231 RepID=A0ABP9K3P5_9SPHN